MSDKELEQEILALENEVKRLEDSTKEIIQSIKERIQNLKDIAWERESKKESSKMYKVLENEKSSTIVKSNVGDVVVDREFMEKEIHKHLDNPALRGMVTTEEMLSFPKVARNVGAEYDIRTKNYTWKAKADDESIIRYGSREYKNNENNINRLLTNYSETEYGERQDRGERGQLRREFNDRNFLRPADESITQNDYIIPQERKIFNEKDIKKISLDERLTLLQSNQQEIANLPRASEVSIKEEEDTKHNNKLDEVKHIKRIKQ